jgi:chromosome segregation ATPase
VEAENRNLSVEVTSLKKERNILQLLLQEREGRVRSLLQYALPQARAERDRYADEVHRLEEMQRQLSQARQELDRLRSVLSTTDSYLNTPMDKLLSKAPLFPTSVTLEEFEQQLHDSIPPSQWLNMLQHDVALPTVQQQVALPTVQQQ